MNRPLITVLMPAYNAENYIQAAIQSVLDQSFQDFELVIVNDGSSDQTEKIILSFLDDRIRLINQENMGVAAALNKGLDVSTAPYIARFDADDICDRGRLEKQYKFMIENPDYVLVGTDVQYVDMNGVFVFELDYPAYTDEEIRQLPYQICPFSHVSVLYKKSIIIAAGMYNVNAHNFEDHFLWRRVIELGKVCNIREKLVTCRFNPASVTIDEKWRGKRFRKLKYLALKNKSINRDDGEEMRRIIYRQDNEKIKKGAYYSLLSKKYLVNNFDPGLARKNIRELIKLYPYKLQGYLLFGLSCLPGFFLKPFFKVK
jgi:glycosyltransferase involved in cell wall biosynthesis